MSTARRKRPFNIEYLSNLLWQKRFYFIVPSIISLMIGMISALLLPRVYEAKTLILVEPQRVPGEYVRAIVAQDIRGRIGTITQQILSRSNLEKVIDKFELFADPQNRQMFMEDKVESLRDQISVQVSRAQGGAEAFSISYRGGVPGVVMQVTNTLASLFIESNLQVREEQAEGTSSFLDDELETMRGKLGSIESELQNYRQRYMGELPEQLDGNLKMLETFRIQLEERKERLRNERNRLVAADNEIEQLKISMERTKPAQALRVRDSDTPIVTKLDELREELKTLLSMYTDQHPNVIRMKSRIKAMENEPPEKPKEKTENTPPPIPTDNSSARLLAERVRQRAMITSSIGSMQEDINKIDRQIKDYQQRIERTPKREEEMLALRRDYQNIQDTYRSLLSRKLEADMAVNMERKKKGEQFKVIDYAKVPEKPISPNLKRVFLLALVAGLSTGLALIFISDTLDDTVRHTDDLLNLGVVNLGIIPECVTAQIARRKTIKNIATIGSISVLCALSLAFGYIAING